MISPGLRMPDTVRSIFREDWKFFAVMTACTTGFAGAMTAAAIALAGFSGDPGMAELLTAYPGKDQWALHVWSLAEKSAGAMPQQSLPLGKQIIRSHALAPRGEKIAIGTLKQQLGTPK